MSAHSALYTRLTTHSGTAALVGTRVYPMILPQTPTLPAVVYQRVSGTGQMGSTTIREARYQFSCWASTYLAAQGLAAQVRDALEEWNGATTPDVKMTRVISELDDYDDDAKIYRVMMDAILLLVE